MVSGHGFRLNRYAIVQKDYKGTYYVRVCMCSLIIIAVRYRYYLQILQLIDYFLNYTFFIFYRIYFEECAKAFKI